MLSDLGNLSGNILSILVVVGDLKGILNAHWDCMGVSDRGGICKRLCSYVFKCRKVFSWIKYADVNLVQLQWISWICFRLDFHLISRRGCAGCQQLKVVNHILIISLVSCTVIIDRLSRKESNNRKLYKLVNVWWETASTRGNWSP